MFSSFGEIFQISLGSLQELTPLSVMGCIFGSIDLLIIAQNIPKHLQFILFVFIHFLFRYNIFILYSGFRFPNIILNILSSTILCVFFGSLKFNKFRAISQIIKYITKYTGGIYYIHPFLRDYLQKYILYFKKKSYNSSMVIYLMCYIICYFGTSLFKNYKLKYLFN